MSVDDGDDMLDSDEDLNDFNALKAKTTHKRKAVTQGSGLNAGCAVMPKTVERDVVIDDFIRNFLVKIKMQKTMNIFQ